MSAQLQLRLVQLLGFVLLGGGYWLNSKLNLGSEFKTLVGQLSVVVLTGFGVGSAFVDKAKQERESLRPQAGE